jgi:putative intracellular protease/amidase
LVAQLQVTFTSAAVCAGLATLAAAVLLRHRRVTA